MVQDIVLERCKFYICHMQVRTKEVKEAKFLCTTLSFFLAPCAEGLVPSGISVILHLALSLPCNKLLLANFHSCQALYEVGQLSS